MRTAIATSLLAFLGLFAGAFSLWSVGNAIRYGITLSHNWKLLTSAVCPPVLLLYSKPSLWPLLLLANVALFAIFGYAISQVFYNESESGS